QSVSVAAMPITPAHTLRLPSTCASFGGTLIPSPITKSPVSVSASLLMPFASLAPSALFCPVPAGCVSVAPSFPALPVDSAALPLQVLHSPYTPAAPPQSRFPSAPCAPPRSESRANYPPHAAQSESWRCQAVLGPQCAVRLPHR